MARAGTVDPEKEKYWRAVFKRFAKSNLPFKKFCEQEGIPDGSFQQWRRKLRERDEIRGLDSPITKGENRPSKVKEKIAFWLRVIDEIEKFPGPIKQYLKQRDLRSGSLWYWEKRLIKEGLTKGISAERRNPFVPVQVKRVKTSANKQVEKSFGDSLRIEVRGNDGRIASKNT